MPNQSVKALPPVAGTRRKRWAAAGFEDTTLSF
jgi:hypothetical protein